MSEDKNPDPSVTNSDTNKNGISTLTIILIFIGVGAAFFVGKHFLDKYNAGKRIGQ